MWCIPPGANAEFVAAMEDTLEVYHRPYAPARRLVERLEIHRTPKHGSWLNMAEIELGVPARQCLAERMDNQEHLTAEVTAWQHARNTAVTRINWRSTTADDRIKLKHLYPQTLPC